MNPHQPRDATLADAVTLHQLALQAEGRSLHTQKQYLQYESLFLRYLEGQRIPPTLGALNLATVHAFLGWYRALPGPRRTRGGEVAVRAAADVLKRLARVIEDHGLVEDSPLRKLQRPRIAKIARLPFSQAELTAMWAASRQTRMPVRDEALFLLLVDTGLRIGEACTLRLDRIDLDQLHVVVSTEGKGRRERIVPIGIGAKRDGGRLVRALRAYLQRRPEAPWGGNHLFLARDGRPLTAAGGNDLIKRIGAMAGVPDAYPHKCRHSFATHYLTIYPNDEIGLRRILGQVSTKVMADYVHISQSTIAQRAGHASLAETLVPPPSSPMSRLSALERRYPVRDVAATSAKPGIDREALVAAVRSDPQLRQALLEALLGGAA
jgi:integrase/recombinase XerD